MSTKKILGLDLGVGSIGWAMVSEHENGYDLLGLGTRIVPLSNEESSEFTKGGSVETNQVRRQKRQIRRGYQRFRLRKKHLVRFLTAHGMMPPAEFFTQMSALELYGLRHKAVHEPISLEELGRVFFHLNQKRGYRSSRKAGGNDEKQETEYLQTIKANSEGLGGTTLGSFFYQKLCENPLYRIKKNIFYRSDYQYEFNEIWDRQATFHPHVLTEARRKELRDQIIFFQRPLRSQKALVGECSLIRHAKKDKNGQVMLDAHGRVQWISPKTAHKSNPLAPITSVYEMVNNLTFSTEDGRPLPISAEQRNSLIRQLMSTEKLAVSKLLKELAFVHPTETDAKGKPRKLGAKEVVCNYPDGLRGNTTRTKMVKAFEELGLKEDHPALRFDLDVITQELADPNTGEVIIRKEISPAVEQQPLYRLWHVLYANEEVIETLQKQFGFTAEQAERLAQIDFSKAGYGNKSSRAMRKILPYLMDGLNYADACTAAGLNHSQSQTKPENQARVLLERLDLIPRNALRSPVVEKILNHLINLINALLADPRYGRPDAIHIELARELKQNAKQRKNAFDQNKKLEKRNEEIRSKLMELPEFKGLSVSKKLMEKYKLWQDQNGLCLYSGKIINLSDLADTHRLQVDHIIPQSKIFDDSYQNKVLVYAHENANKGDLTALEYMSTKSEGELQSYHHRLTELKDAKIISTAKLNKLKMMPAEIPQDFIERQLRQTQFIAKHAMHLLKEVCYDVVATSGSVTDYLRQKWGYDDVLMRLHLPKYRDLNLTRQKTVERGGKAFTFEEIPGWTKRNDHRHHALDAVVIACTKHSYIQQLNTLAAGIDENDPAKRHQILIRKEIAQRRPFEVSTLQEQLAGVFISIKSGKRLATPAKNNVVKKAGKTLLNQPVKKIPRGALHQETVYGKVWVWDEPVTVKLNGRFDPADAPFIRPRAVRKLVTERLAAHDNQPKAAFKTELLTPDGTPILAVTVVRKAERFVLRETLAPGFKDFDDILDPVVRQKVVDYVQEVGEKNAFKNLAEQPIYFHKEKGITIQKVRIKTGYNVLASLRKDANGKAQDWVRMGSNHHVALYYDEQGQVQERLVSFFEASQRVLFGLPALVKDPAQLWTQLETQTHLPQHLLDTLPMPGWKFWISFSENELVFLDVPEEEVNRLKENPAAFTQHCYRVQKLSETYYVFRQIYETKVEDKSMPDAIQMKLNRFQRAQSFKALLALRPIKARVNYLGQIDFA